MVSIDRLDEFYKESQGERRMRSTLSTICYISAGVFFLIGILFAGASILGKRIPDPQMVENILSQAKEVESQVEGAADNPGSAVLLSLILNEIRSLPSILFFTAGVIFAVQLLMVGLLISPPWLSYLRRED